MPKSHNGNLDWRKITKSLTEADYSRKVAFSTVFSEASDLGRITSDPEVVISSTPSSHLSIRSADLTGASLQQSSDS
jgi:hypothetical protein